MQTPWIATTVGFALCSSIAISVCRFGSCSARGVPNSLMSAPPEKDLPAPLTTSATTAGSASARSKPAAIATRVS